MASLLRLAYFVVGLHCKPFWVDITAMSFPYFLLSSPIPILFRTRASSVYAYGETFDAFLRLHG